MRKLLISSLVCFITLSTQVESAPNQRIFARKNISEADLMAKVDSLISKMTLDEKIGQMTQVTLDVISEDNNSGSSGTPHRIDKEKLKTAILKYHVGSILNVAGDKAHTLEHWHDIITEIQSMALKDRLKIPVIYGIDSIHGAHYTVGATLFPQSINVAATWDTKNNFKVGEITALETRASGIPWNFFPVLDLGRQFLWSRFFETYGEDVYLTKTMGRANISGQQLKDLSDKTKVAACLKHYLGYSVPQSGKDKTPAIITERMIREYFLPPFAEAIKEGAETVMVNTGEIDGIPGHVNYHLLTEILKGELNFKGFAVSDWLDIKKLYERDHLASSYEEATKMAIMAGIDMSMVPYDFSFIDVMKKLVKAGEIPQSRIDDAVRRILRVKMMLGLFENPMPDKSLVAQFATPESAQISRKMAGESLVLVKNEKQFLPLNPSRKQSIFVTGPTANSLASLNGGWTLSWQGNNESLYPKNKKTVLQALQDRFGNEKITYYKGVELNTKANDYDIALSAASRSDIIILALGEKAYTEVPGNIDDLTLDEAQLQYAQELAKLKKPIILLMLQGRPRVIRKIVDQMQSIVIGMLPGIEGGLAFADLIAGDINPSAKLPFSYPRAPNDLLHYDHKYQEISEDKFFNPEWSFGFGLSYTEYQYSRFGLSSKTMNENQTIKASVQVTNVGDHDGSEVVQLYISDLYRKDVTPPVKQLKNYKKIFLKAGESQMVEFSISIQDLMFIGKNNKNIYEKGKFKIQVGDQTDEFELN